ncbi:hypothetical protein GCM10007276_04650 [Agaricicola taiwanensis]|uniref:HTH luxR-type domain-containing protein n=2 Tax=Agaricicola taiwanensis TaxID=591372 RepID=A0A8J2VID2_9RHOB|nr:hypothetical protein GCM10007276_04650 [Agaricicola taiwanensis]
MACLRQLRQPRLDLVFESYASLEPEQEEPNCCLAFCIEDSTDGSRYIIAALLNRRGGQTTSADRDAVTDLAPKLAETLWHYKASARGTLLRELESTVAQSVPWGLMALSWWGTVLAHNGIAGEMLRQGDALRMQGRRLCFARAATARRFLTLTEAVILQAASEPQSEMALPVVDTTGTLRFALKIIPYDRGPAGPGDAVAMVMLADLAARAGVNECVLASAFALSAKEARLASLLGNGCNLDEAAQNMSISRNTARIHLSHVLHKTGARNQVALARLLARLPASRGSAFSSAFLQG